MTRAFADTNILVYRFSADPFKCDRAKTLIASSPHVSVQVLNELANVARRKMGLAWAEIGEITAAMEANCTVEPVTIHTHRLALELAASHPFGWYDACLLASALLADCRTFWSEDMQDGLRIRGLQIRNPFRA